MHATYEVSIFYGSKVIAKVKVDSRQTDKQTQDKNNLPPIIRSGGIKTIFPCFCENTAEFNDVGLFSRILMWSILNTCISCLCQRRHGFLKFSLIQLGRKDSRQSFVTI